MDKVSLLYFYKRYVCSGKVAVAIAAAVAVVAAAVVAIGTAVINRTL
jgi:hypothetical protein